MTQLTSNAKWVVRYVAFLRAHSVLVMQSPDGQQRVKFPASNGFVLPQGDGQGSYQIHETEPALDDDIAAVFKLNCIHLTLEDDDGNELYDNLFGGPLEDGELLGVTVAEDVLFDLARIQEGIDPAQFAEVQMQLTQMGTDKVIMLFNPHAQGQEMIPLFGDVKVENTPQNIQDVIDAELAAAGADGADSGDADTDPNTDDDLFK